MGVLMLIPTKVRLRLAMIGAATACCVACVSPTGPNTDLDRIEIRGRIFGQTLQGPQNPNGSLAPDVYVNPVAGAVISTSLDSATTVSDGDGNFVLRTSTAPGGQSFALRINAAGYPTYDRSGCWGGVHSQVIALTWTQSDPIASVACN